MDKDFASTLIGSRTGFRRLCIEVTIIAGFVAMMAIFSWIKVPLTVPITLQTMGVFLAIGILGTKRGTAAIASFVGAGLLGLPVFAGFAGGPAYLLGASGGYIIGFIPTAIVAGLIMDKLGKSVPAMFISMLAGLAVCYAFGTAWFMGIYGSAAGLDVYYVLSICVIPFVIPDIIKIALAITVCKLVSQIRSK